MILPINSFRVHPYQINNKKQQDVNHAHNSITNYTLSSDKKQQVSFGGDGTDWLDYDTCDTTRTLTAAEEERRIKENNAFWRERRKIVAREEWLINGGREVLENQERLWEAEQKRLNALKEQELEYKELEEKVDLLADKVRKLEIGRNRDANERLCDILTRSVENSNYEAFKYYKNYYKDFLECKLCVQNLNGKTFKNIDFSNMDFEQVNFENSKFENVNFANSHLKNTNFKNAEFKNCNFEKANLEKANLEEAKFIESNLCKANLCAAGLNNIQLKNCNLENTKLSEASLSKAQVIESNLSNATMNSTYLVDAKIMKSNLSNANLEYSNLMKVQIIDSNLRDAKLYRSWINDGIMEKVILTNGDLKVVNFTNAKLKNCDLKKAVLNEAVFTNALCEKVNFENANLRSAKMDNAKFENCDFKNASLEYAKMDNAKFKNCDFEDADINTIELSKTVFDNSLDIFDYRLQNCDKSDSIFNGVSLEELSKVYNEFQHAIIHYDKEKLGKLKEKYSKYINRLSFYRLFYRNYGQRYNRYDIGFYIANSSNADFSNLCLNIRSTELGGENKFDNCDFSGCSIIANNTSTIMFNNCKFKGAYFSSVKYDNESFVIIDGFKLGWVTADQLNELIKYLNEGKTVKESAKLLGID